MQKFASLSDAIALAEFAHRNQLDKAGLPYIDHPRRVLEKVKAQGALPYVQIAAILHDVTEDTSFTDTMLIQLGFSEAAVNIVRLLDRDRNAEYGYTNDEYYTRIAADPGAKMVKLADIEDNLSPWRQSYLTPETQHRLRRKYRRAVLILEHGLTGEVLEKSMKNWDEENQQES
jgi:(p)ppGpp synthase/HD superfamily hydrolase